MMWSSVRSQLDTPVMLLGLPEGSLRATVQAASAHTFAVRETGTARAPFLVLRDLLLL
jgi:hypothetical protein